MYEIDFDLGFSLGMNLETISLFLNIGIPIVYFANFIFLAIKLRGMDKDAPFYTFMKSLAYFFLFYGLGSIYFVWYDFFYMDAFIPNPINVLFGTDIAPPDEAAYLWQIGNLIQNVGLLLMIVQLRTRVLKGKFKQIFPIIWELIGFSITIFTILNFFSGFGVYIPLISDVPIFWLEMLFLFNFCWSIALPLTYRYIWKNAAGKMKRYSFILFLCFILFGLGWGLRSRTAVYMAQLIFEWLPLLGAPNIFSPEIIWLLRAADIVINLGLVLYAYKKLLGEF